MVEGKEGGKLKVEKEEYRRNRILGRVRRKQKDS